MAEHAPVFLLLGPLFAALAVSLVGLRYEKACLPITLAGLASALASAIVTLVRVVDGGVVTYFLGGWAEPLGIGIEFRVDHLNGIVLVVIATVGIITAVYSAGRVAEESPGRTPQFYAIYLLAVTGLMGMTVTGDAFNLYVLLEVASLTGYALVALGTRSRAAVAALNYVLVGTIGASFYLLGVGYLYIKTGSLNMIDIQRIIGEEGLAGSATIHVAFALILIGVWIKMAFFPLFGWLPNAYTYAPSASACLLAPLVTKVSVYVMVRMMLTVFGPGYVFDALAWHHVVVWLAVVAIIAGSVIALAQTDLKKMLCYLIVAEVGYMVGGAWLANHYGMVGAVYHLVSDAFMTLCLFLGASILVYRTKQEKIAGLQGMFRQMPLTMGAFTLGALSMIGIPPTCGFFSKFYLIRGGIEAGQWEYVVALLVSSVINAVLFFRIIEIAYFHPPAGDGAADGAPAAAGPAIKEAPLSMLLPFVAASVALLLIGLFNKEIVGLIEQTLNTYALGGGGVPG